MKSKRLVLACALTAVTFSFNAFSQEISSICTDPLKTICIDTKEQRAQKDAYILKLKKEIASEAEKKSAPRIEEMKKKVPRLKFFKRAILSYKIRNQEIMSAAKKRVAGIESVVTNPQNVARLKNYMNQAISESAFNETTKSNFRNTINSIVIGNFGDFLEKMDLENNVLAQILSNACGSDGLVANAFATTLKNEKYVLICPGFLITLSQTATDEERFNTILLAISHEMGHHIDNGSAGNEIYKPYLSCLADNHVEKFKKTEEDTKLCSKKPAECNEKVVLSHAGELIADAWGIKVLNIHLRTERYSFADTDTMLTQTWSGLCGTQDEGIHPTGDFRMGTMLRMNPGISDYLSCNNSSINSKPACTLEGAVNI